MEFSSRSQEEILAELQSWTLSPESRVEGTFEFDCFSTNAIEFMKIELELAEAYRANFAQTSWGEYLDMRAAEHGLERRAANYAIGTLTVTGNGTIPAGSIFATENGTRFTAVAETVVTSSATIDIVAAKAGASGNVAAGTIIKIPLSIAGIQSCVNEAATYDGYDAEDDDTLKERLLDKVRHPATSGNPYEYVQWALEVVGVGAARCVRCPYGPGTVKVVVVDSNFETANAELLERVYEHINSRRPVGILNGQLYVVSASPVVINVSADITGTIDADAFRDSLQEYFSAMIKRTLSNYQGAADGGLVSVAKIGSLILTAGGADTYDMDTLLVNDSNDDIALDVEQLPTIGEINFT